MLAKHYHSLDELDDLEEAAIECMSSDRVEALRIVAPIFNHNNLDYGLIGGTNFYLRGPARSMTDVDIAISGHWSLAQVLDMLEHDARITHPAPLKTSPLGERRSVGLCPRQQHERNTARPG